jgi:hypothetical protein
MVIFLVATMKMMTKEYLPNHDPCGRRPMKKLAD